MSSDLIPTEAVQTSRFSDGQGIASLVQAGLDVAVVIGAPKLHPANLNTPRAEDEEEYAEVYFAHG